MTQSLLEMLLVQWTLPENKAIRSLDHLIFQLMRDFVDSALEQIGFGKY